MSNTTNGVIIHHVSKRPPFLYFE